MGDRQSTMIAITSADVGARLDLTLGRALSLTRSQSRALLATGQVLLNDRAMTESDKGRLLEAGDHLEVKGVTNPRERKPLAVAGMSLEILFENEDVVVVNKPAGMPVHPLAYDEVDTILNGLIERYPQMAGVGEGALRCGVVHRLDVETSGVLIFALHEVSYRQLRRAFSNHQTQKTYRAVITGTLKGEGSESVDLVVARHAPAKIEVARDPDLPGVRRCTLDWCALAHGAGRTLLEVDLHTGFLHQIRATFAAMQCPIVGDERYGGAVPDVSRMLLHALSLEACGVTVETAMPAEFQRALSPAWTAG